MFNWFRSWGSWALVAVVAVLVVVAGPVPATSEWDVGFESEWELAFFDDFDGSSLDEAHWVTCYWWAVDGCAIGTNGELQWYQPDNVNVSGGEAQLSAEVESVTTHDGEVRSFTSGMVSTGRATSNLDESPRFSFTYGRVEVRARVPAGQGLWPALWLLPIDHESRPEIDIMEVLGHDTDTLRMHYHRTVDGERSSLGRNVMTIDLNAGWHTYALEWTPVALVWFLDGHERWRIEGPSIVPHEPMYFIANLAVGGPYPGSPTNDTEFPSTFSLDFVKVWQRVAQ